MTTVVVNAVAGIPPSTVSALAQSGLTFIHSPTGSMANNGAVTFGTALSAIFPDCYVLLPIGAVAASVPAAEGWYYCQMSSTTVGTVFNNAYTTGQPVAPTNPTAFVTTGPGAFTGSTTERAGPNIKLPALSSSASVNYTLASSNNNSAGAKTIKVRISDVGGTTFMAGTVTTGTYWSVVGGIAAAGKTNSQQSWNLPSISLATQTALGTVDLSITSNTAAITLLKAVATDVVELRNFTMNIASN